MKRFLFLAVGLLIAALFFFTVALAQEPAAAPVPGRPGIVERIKVLKGGNLALIAEGCGHRQTEWPALAAANPNLPKPEKVGEMWRVWIQPNQVLNLPAGWSYGTLNPEAVEPAPSRAGTGPSILAPVVEIPPPPASVTDSNRSLWRLDPAVWVLILLILVAIAFLATIAAPFIRRRDPSRYQARVNGGLSADLDTAVRQLGIAYPGRRYTRIEQCRLVRDGGPRRILVRRMDFGDGVSRDAYLNDGDQVYRGTLPGGSCDYFLRSCGNLGPEFRLPAGWRVAVIQSQDITRPASPIPPAPVFSSEPEPAPETALASVSEPVEPPAHAEEPPAAEAKQAPTSNEVEVTVDGLLIRVVGKNGEIPATKIRTGDGVEVTLQGP